MKTKHFMAILGLLWSVDLASVCAAGAPPNIVYLIADDQCFRDFGFMGNEKVHTPSLDALAAQSARCVNGTVPTSECRPSLMTFEQF